MALSHAFFFHIDLAINELNVFSKKNQAKKKTYNQIDLSIIIK
jgi:hypothetical protein